MSRIQHLTLLADYNLWMNEKLYTAARQLAPDVLHADRRAFFGSIFGTLNHIAVADTLWLKRFAYHPAQFQSLEPLRSMAAPAALDELLFASLEQLASHRDVLDRIMLGFAQELKDADLDSLFEYKSTKGVQGCKNFYGVLMHFFNHQTHHRGQATTLFTQLGVDVGATDLLLLLPNADE